MQERDPLEKFESFFRDRYYKELMEVAKNYPEQRSIVVNYFNLDKFDTELGDSLLQTPEETLKIAQEAISEIDLPIEGDCKINLRVKDLPDSHHVNIRDIRAEHIDKFVRIEGIVKSAADVRPEAVKTVFECPSCRGHISIYQITKKMTTPMMCDNPTCGHRGKFKLVETELMDSQRIKIQEPPETIIGGEQPSQLYIHLTDDLVSPKERKKSMPGNRVLITGIVKKMPVHTRTGTQTTGFDLYMMANHLIPIEREFEEIELTKKDIAQIKKLAKDSKLYEKFTASIAPSIYGYDRIKEAILLQLFGGVPKVNLDGTKIRGDIHLFLLGDPAVGKSQLLWYVSGLAPKGRFVSGKKASGVGLTAAVVRDEFAGGWTLEAGALILANNGVACVDEFDKMTEDDRSAMLEAMEQGTISIAKAGIVTTLRAKTSVLAAANPKYGRFDKYRLLSEQIDLSPVILSRFDLKFPIQDVPDTDKDSKLADHILEAVTNPKKIEPKIPADLVRKYIAYARINYKPKLTKQAVKVIKDFYITWRSKYVTEEGETTVALTPRQLEALVRIAEASAKVRLSNTVTQDDAKRATDLLEYSLRALGTEPETGKIDIDRIEAGTSSVQRSKIHTMLTIMDELIKKIGKNVPVEDVLAEATARGMEELATMELIEKLKAKGDLFEPRPGFLQKA